MDNILKLIYKCKWYNLSAVLNLNFAIILLFISFYYQMLPANQHTTVRYYHHPFDLQTTTGT